VIQITHKRMSVSGSKRHEHISAVKWYNPKDGNVDSSTVATMVTWLRKGNRAYVCDGYNIVEVGVVEANPPYIRTHADKKWTDNLLALPAF
jgi:hypothetical protein